VGLQCSLSINMQCCYCILFVSDDALNSGFYTSAVHSIEVGVVFVLLLFMLCLFVGGVAMLIVSNDAKPCWRGVVLSIDECCCCFKCWCCFGMLCLFFCPRWVSLLRSPVWGLLFSLWGPDRHIPWNSLAKQKYQLMVVSNTYCANSITVGGICFCCLSCVCLLVGSECLLSVSIQSRVDVETRVS